MFDLQWPKQLLRYCVYRQTIFDINTMVLLFFQILSSRNDYMSISFKNLYLRMLFALQTFLPTHLWLNTA